MGLNIGRSSCRCININNINLQKGNPDPKNFKIKFQTLIGEYLFSIVNYPDCTNYEGTKILVFRSVDCSDLSNLKNLDPHFCDNHISPIMRISPSYEGLKLLKNLMYLAKIGKL